VFHVLGYNTCILTDSKNTDHVGVAAWADSAVQPFALLSNYVLKFPL
jgi:hypothetical protein